MYIKSLLSVFIIALLLSSCKVYKRDIILQYDDEFQKEDLEESVYRTSINYVIETGDILTLDLYSNEGESLIEPNPVGAGLEGVSQSSPVKYLVLQNGTVKFPIVGMTSLVGMTLHEAEEVLQEAYDEFYKDSFVQIQVDNRRVIVLGAFGGGAGQQQNQNSLTGGAGGSTGGQVIPIENENMTIMEVVALAGGIRQGSRVSTIKLVRGDLDNPKVYEMDLSTITGMTRTAMVVENGDIIYMEPWRRPFRQSLAELAPWLSLTTGVLTFTLLLQNTSK